MCMWQHSVTPSQYTQSENYKSTMYSYYTYELQYHYVAINLNIMSYFLV